MGLPRTSQVKLNRLRTGVWGFYSSMYKWGLAFLNENKIKVCVCKTAPTKLKFYPTQDRIALYFKTLMTKFCSYIDSLLCFKKI